MKKNKKTALTAALFATALNFNACTSPDVDIQTEYGAPIAIPEETYKPEEEEPQEVYGPPEYFDNATEQEPSENPEEVNEESQPENQPEETIEKYNIPQIVYGPPEAFGGE